MTSPYSHDINMVQAYLAGDKKTEKLLYRDLTHLISNLVRSMSGKGFTFADSENVVSDIVYQIMVADDRKVIRAFRGECKLSTYLWPIVRNKIIDAGRREKRQREKVVYQDEYDSDISAPNQEPGLIEMEIKAHVDAQPPVERFIKIAKWIEGLCYNEIIEQAGDKFPDSSNLNTQRIAYVLHSNRKELQHKLKKSGFHFD